LLHLQTQPFRLKGPIVLSSYTPLKRRFPLLGVKAYRLGDTAHNAAPDPADRSWRAEAKAGDTDDDDAKTWLECAEEIGNS
jgi:hypothetical protein